MLAAPSSLTGQLAEALDNTRTRLLGLAGPQGAWEGRLSSSALATAVAVAALSWVDAVAHEPLIRAGLRWLAGHQNPDGGWGDTPCSPSNASTTLLCWAAFHREARSARDHPHTLERAGQWLARHLGSLDPQTLAQRVLASYGSDRTFSVPILTLCALCGRLGEGREAWAHIPQLPFELAAVPHRWFKLLRLPVVSYAIPALIAIGLARHENAGAGWSPLRSLRQQLKPRVLLVLQEIQPASGGFLEAVPLTAFVTMALAASGLEGHPVARAGAQFLVRAARADGSWPIDINLATWVTTLCVNALSAEQLQPLTPEHRRALLGWLLAQQHQQEHPFTHAAPGGWAWTDLPGGVPDADDTAGALLAMWHLKSNAAGALGAQEMAAAQSAAQRGLQWLLELQNRDGGVPTFCRGWQRLPFDRSCPDLTAHAVAAWSQWKGEWPPKQRLRLAEATRCALNYLQSTQRADGAWIPLWFGNQHVADKTNPVYGTARVLQALVQLPCPWGANVQTMLSRGQRWLIRNQHAGGGWGGGPGSPPSVEETALALQALAVTGCRHWRVMQAGAQWLLAATKNGTEFTPAPIGLYFAALWYTERVYPVVFSFSAFHHLKQFFASSPVAPAEEEQTTVDSGAVGLE